VNSKFGCIKNKDTTGPDDIKCKRIGNAKHFRDFLYKDPSVRDEWIKVTEVMEYEIQATDRPISVRGKI